MNVIELDATAILEPDEEYTQRSDNIPGFWQFLNGLSRDDIITELIQNELDANSTHTTIDFYESGFSCSGNGDKVDSDGWIRLSYLWGAGDRAPRKKNKTGVKNHGMKSYFTVGDKITIRSDGKRAIQTLYMNGLSHPPSPGVTTTPSEDPTAPLEGCRIDVTYRTNKLVAPVGEPLEFEPPTNDVIEQLFTDACRDIPERFLGALSPGRREQYTLELKHYRLGSIQFCFKCRNPRKTRHPKKTRQFEVYRRECVVKNTLNDNFGKKPDKVIEDCHRFVLPQHAGSNIEIQEFYFSNDKFFFVEISWRTNGRKPYKTHGRKRYPIAFSSGQPNAMSELGIHISAPYICDTERHGPSDAPHNQYIDQRCREKLIELLRDYFLPTFGPKALALMYDVIENKSDIVALREMILLLIENKSLPLYQPQQRRRKTKTTVRSAVKLGPALLRNGHQRKVLIPSFSWNKSSISPALIKVCPKKEPIAHPDIPQEVFYAWADNVEDTLCNSKRFAFFDEYDALFRWVYSNYETIPWDDKTQWESEVNDWQRTRCYLDILNTALDNKSAYLNSHSYNTLREIAILPTIEGPPRPINELYSGAELPASLQLEELPPFVHDKLSEHAVFTRPKWSIHKFTLSDFVHQLEKSQLSEKQKHKIWLWLTHNWHEVAPASLWRRLVKLTIWKDKKGNFWQLSNLCQPNSKEVSKIMSSILLFPDEKILQIKPVCRADTTTALRTHPTVREINLWLRVETEGIPLNTALPVADIARFKKFEKRLTTLINDDAVKKELLKSDFLPIALNKAEQLRPVLSLVQCNQAIAQLYLNREDVIDQAPTSPLQAIKGWGASSHATSNQILAALEQNPKQTDALESRLHAFVKACRREHRNVISTIGSLRCIPVGEKLYAPIQLALSSAHTHRFFGQWKTVLPSNGMDQSTKKVYREVGVLASEPTSETSRLFFQWLSDQSETVIRNHLTCIFRNIDNKHGPNEWAHSYDNIPFIPVETQGKVKLVSRVQLKSPSGKIYIPDFDSLASIIRESPSYTNFKLVIISIKGYKNPIKEAIQTLGGRSLKEAAGKPLDVKPNGNIEINKDLNNILAVLTSPKMTRELKKRLGNFDIPMKDIRSDWTGRLKKLKEVYIADTLHATFKLSRNHLSCVIPHIILEQESKIWLARNEKANRRLFYEAIAHLIFNQPNNSYPVVLKEAIEQDFKEHTPVDNINEQEDAPEDETEGLPGVNKRKKNHPTPGEIELPKPGRPIGGGVETPGDGPSPPPIKTGRAKSKSEKNQVQELKEYQYAYNCQACLVGASPEKLAPPGSYAYLADNKKALIDSHHPDPVSVGGARDGSNILILCNHHHRLLGDKFRREAIMTALKENVRPHIVTFCKDGKSVELKGIIVDITQPGSDIVTSIFFSDKHYKLWLES